MFPLVVAATLFWRPAGPSDPQVLHLVQPATPKICHGTWCEPAKPEEILGGWNTQEYYFREFSAGKWGKIAKPPIDPPGRPKNRPNHGIELKDRPNMGMEVPTRQRKPLIPGPKSPLVPEVPDFPDDSKLPRLTAVGITAKVPAELKDKVLYKEYPDGHWAVKDLCKGLKTPALILQVDGKVVFTLQDLSAGLPPQWASKVGEALGKKSTPPIVPATPDDEPLPPPPPETPEPPLAPTPSDPPIGWIAFLISLVLLWRKQ